MGMCRTLLAVAITLCAPLQPARATGSVDSTDCRRALQALEAREAELLASRKDGARADDRDRPAPDARLQTLRQQAARACLGDRADAATPPRQTARPPIVVTPVGIGPPASKPPLPAAAAQPSAGRIDLPPVEPPLVVTGCDAGGCWASDGSRLQRLGDQLLGPRGLCTLQGTFLRCP